MILSPEEKYQAILSKDSRYEGQFITAVKTTGIFCRPVCTARKPKFENVEFFENPTQAMANGYRPCKVCRPLEAVNHQPDEINQVLELISRSPNNKLTDANLKSMGFEPNTIRRWFKKNHGVTFQAYQRKLVLKKAHHAITAGKSISNTAFDAGYESLSGFSDSFRRTLKVSPSQAAEATILHICELNSPLGMMTAAATDEGICLLEFSDRPGLEEYIEKLSHQLLSIPMPGSNEHLEQLKQELSEYFQGARKEFHLNLFFNGTDFQKTVWRALQNIPYGKTCTYTDQANSIKNPEAVRAVAAANGQNRIAIVIPCHRVIGKNGSLTGYAGGITRKRWLLDHEQGVGRLF